jgi:hypothetical protein
MATLITGGDNGIGRAIGIAYAREGADVAISFLPQEEEDAAETARWVRDTGRKCLMLSGDIREEAHCNNAAFQMTDETLEEFSSDEWDLTFRTNIYSDVLSI